jgi:hypothetical protein
LLFGGLLASIFVLGCQRQPAVAGPDPAVHKRFPLNGTDDSPVLARGGSMEFLSGNQWNPTGTSSTTAYNTSGVDVTEVSMDGVEPIVSGTAGAPESVTATGIPSNWYMSLTFRKSDDSLNANYLLLICTSNTFNPQDNSCSTTGPITNKNALYLFDAGSQPGTFHWKSENEKYDSLYRLAYSVSQCKGTGDSTDAHCDHIKKITVSNINNFQNASGTAVTATDFICRAGACDIGFGN